MIRLLQQMKGERKKRKEKVLADLPNWSELHALAIYKFESNFQCRNQGIKK